jgi:hypothetical protein
MSDAEFIVVALDIVVIFVAYFVVYPTYCGANGYRIAAYDLLLSGMVLLISGSLFWDSGELFNLLFFLLTGSGLLSSRIFLSNYRLCFGITISIAFGSHLSWTRYLYCTYKLTGV